MEIFGELLETAKLRFGADEERYLSPIKFGLARALKEREEFVASEAIYREVISSSKYHKNMVIETYRGLSDLLTIQKRDFDPFTIIKSVIHNPDHAHHYTGLIYQHQGEISKARYHYEQTGMPNVNWASACI